MGIANIGRILWTQKIVVRSGKMGLLKVVKKYESSFRDFWDSMDELYKTIILLPNSEDRDNLLKKYGKVEQCREQHWDSVENLIEIIDEQVRIK